MNDVLFYFDESGYKGYISEEPNKDDFLIIAGFILPNRSYNSVYKKLNSLFDDYLPMVYTKLHSAEIFNDGKNTVLRDRVFDFLLSQSELVIIYDAIYCYGYYKDRARYKEIKDKASNGIKNRKIVLSNNVSKENIYHEVLEGIIVKLDELCKILGYHDLVMISDRIDEKMLKKSINTLDYLKQEEHVYMTTGFNTETKQVVKGTVTSKTSGFDLRVKNINKILIEKQVNHFTFLADIISNSIYRHLYSKISSGYVLGLNSEDIMKDFILQEKIAFLDNDYVIDKIYTNNQ